MTTREKQDEDSFDCIRSDAGRGPGLTEPRVSRAALQKDQTQAFRGTDPKPARQEPSRLLGRLRPSQRPRQLISSPQCA